MDIIDKYNSWNHNLLEEYKKLWPEATYHIWDGVISPMDYYNAPIKIMFLNKEAYGDEYDISEALKEELEASKPIFCNYPIKYNIKNRMSVLRYIGCSDLNSLNDDLLSSYSEADFYKDMLMTAYCNIKKSDGIGKSNTRNLRECFNRNKDILEEQISFFNPTVIVGGNIVDGIIENDFEWGETLYESKSHYINIYQVIIRGEKYPFLDMYHPARPMDHFIDRTELFRAIKDVAENNPHFWQERCNNKCFGLI